MRSTALRSTSRVSAAWFPADEAVAAWKKEYPSIYAAGWGPTTKAERWNGRHAMFGWIALLATGYAKAHGLIPNPDTLLDTKVKSLKNVKHENGVKSVFYLVGQP